ncbi:MAG: molybdopterin-dependent oxidoreductase [FCB group bacterium]|nr:molybdopterin-dependent oxidoreductase [FCB group bacterium]
MRVIGKKTVRVDGRALVKGKPVFADDIEIQNLLHLKILHSPHAHARIRSIDASEALAMEGVVAVLTHEDFAPHYFTTAGQGYPEPSPRDMRVLDSVVRFVGDRVAVVAAESPELAAEALAKIRVDYEPLPAIFDSRESMKSSIVIHPEPGATGIYDAERNIAAHFDVEIGNVDKALEESEHLYEGTYSTPYVQQASIEPHISLSWWDENDRLVIRTSTQVPFHVRRIVAEMLDLPIGKIRVIKPRLGGGFGGKQEILNEELCAAVTLKTGFPARLEYTREEEFYAARTRHPQTVKLRIGLNQDLTINAIDMDILENTGAYGAHALTVMSVTAQKTLSLYRAPNVRVNANAVYTNLPIAGAYRGYGAPQGFFALEVLMDEIAHDLGVDPIDLRHKNYVRVGDEIPIARVLGEGREGFPMKILSSGLEECLEEGKKLIGWEKIRSKPKSGIIRRGVGVAIAAQGSGIPGIDMGSVFLKMNEDASFNMLVGATDLGTGSDTALAQIAAEVLEVPVEKILVYSSDTDLTPFDTGAYASSTTYVSGGAVKKAAEKVKAQLLELGKKLLDVKAATIKEGYVIGDSGEKITYREICTKTFYTDEQTQIMATASHVSYDSPPPFNATFAEVAVDIETGIVTVNRIVSVTDAGQVINPQMAEGQAEGAIPQSLGMALSEYMIFDEKGVPLNRDFFQYHIYTAIDMPEIVTKFISTNEPTGPFGAKAAAEIPVNGPAPAVVNAIYNACGVRMRKLPVTPEELLEELSKQK